MKAFHRALLVCPTCHGDLRDADSNALECAACDTSYPQVNDVPRFRSSGEDAESERAYIEGVRGWLRRHPALYEWVFRLLAPVLVTGPDAAKALEDVDPRGGVIDLGAGNDRRHPEWMNVDLLPYPEVDVVADATRLPFADERLAGVVCIVVLEHVPDPVAVLDEIHRVLGRGGRLFLAVPFLQPFHAAPHDYRRWTVPGLREELQSKGFHVRRAGVYCGPASAVAWLLAEVLALVFSLGSERWQARFRLPAQVLCSPLKWLDWGLTRLRGSENLASAIYAEAIRK